MDIFLVRYPIFDKQQKIFGYRIRRRSAFSAETSLDSEKMLMESALLLSNLNKLTRGKKAFIDVTRSLFQDEKIAHSLPKEHVVLEVLEGFGAARSLIDSCKRLKADGYVLALGSFVLRDDIFEPLRELADIINIDCKRARSEEMRNPNDALSRRGADLLAEGAESREDFQLALEAGCAYFQGSFFKKPVLIPRKDIPGYKLSYLRLLHEVNREDIDYERLEKIVKQDVSLSYKLLNYMSSAYWGGTGNVSNIRKALTRMGEREIRKWTSLVILTGLAEDRPPELIVQSLVRAYFCELLASSCGLKRLEKELFLMGLFSFLDVFVGRPIEEVVKEMPLPGEIRIALCGGRNRCGALLDLVSSYEAGDLTMLLSLTARFNLSEEAVTDLYLKAIEMAEEQLQVYERER